MKSKDFFKQNKTELSRKRELLILYFRSQEMDEQRVEWYFKAYDYFTENPTKFNGATGVKDLHHINGLDINAMLHDYFYEVLKVASNFYYKYYADFIYGKEKERTGRGSLSWVRFVGVTIAGVYFIPKSLLIRGFMSNLEKQQMNFAIKAFK